MKIRYVLRERTAGFVTAGTGPLDPRIVGGKHIDGVLWLVAQLEMPTGFGAVQNAYDDAVMSAGVLHHTAVLPREGRQGSLWGLVRALPRCEPVDALNSRLARAGWTLKQDAVLRNSSGKAVTASEIRREIVGASMRVPPRGPEHEHAMSWALAFAAAFADSSTHSTQLQYAADWLIRESQNEAYSTLCRYTTTALAAADSVLDLKTDLTMAVYHSFSANAPGEARRILQKWKGGGPELIAALGTSAYGNWRDTDDGKSRYDRTRVAALRSGFWPADLINSYMPETIPIPEASSE